VSYPDLSLMRNNVSMHLNKMKVTQTITDLCRNKNILAFL